MDNKEENVGIVIDSTPDKNKKLKERWTTINQVSKVGAGIFSTGLAASLISPLDVEGPVIEIITAVGAIVCFSLDNYSKQKLEEIEKEGKAKNPDDTGGR